MKQGTQGPQKHSSLESLKFKSSFDTGHFTPATIINGKTVKNVQTDLKTMEIWPKQLIVTLCLSDILVREKLSF